MADATTTPALPTWERPRITGEQFLGLSESEAMQEARRKVIHRLNAMGFPVPVIAALGLVFGHYTADVLNATVDCPPEDFDRAMRVVHPEVVKDFEAGRSPLESARRRFKDRLGEQQAKAPEN